MTDTAQRDAAALDILEKLIAFDTTSHLSNMGLIDYVRAYLGEFGIDCELIHDEADPTKANLYATIGRRDVPGVMLSGHTDVVPVEGQEWSSDPFVLRDGGDKVFGRGTCDMKGFIAVVLAMVPQFAARDLATPVHLAFSYDEEVGCTGVRGLVRMLGAAPVKPRLCIVGEPTSMGVVIGHKGTLSFKIHARGHEVHSSLAPQGVNAVEYAARMVTFLSDEHRKRIKDGPFADGFDVPHSTIHVGVIEGGTAQNIVPRDCTFHLEMRHVPGEDTDAFRKAVEDRLAAFSAEMQAVQPETGLRIAASGQTPGLNMDPDQEAVTLVKNLAGRNDHTKVAFATEAGLFQAWSHIPSVVCGPGSIAQAHKPDEFIAKSQLAACGAFMDRLLERVEHGL
jgi:acetylornithine deacetylase